MLSLPPIALDDDEGEYELVLPLASLEWIRLLAWQISDRSSIELAQQLAGNPGLLVYAAILFRKEEEASSESVGELCEWFRDRVSDLLFRHDIPWTPPECEPDRFLKNRYEFKGGRSFRKQLRKYLRSSINDRSFALSRLLHKLVNLPKPRSKALVARYLKVLLDQPAPVFANSIVAGCGRDRAPDAVTVARLLNQFRETESQKSQFQQRLQREKLASLHQLAYGASHEINNPLANIATRAQSLLGSESNPDRRSKLSTIYEQAMRSHDMISDLMLFANPPALDCERIDLKRFLSQLIRQAEAKLKMLQSKSASKLSVPFESMNGSETCDAWIDSKSSAESQQCPIQLIVRIAPGINSFVGDRSQLNVAVLALIQNGIESLQCSAGGTLEVRVSKRNDSVFIEVVDDGRGVSSSIVGHIFDPFFSGREAGRGLGFGLSKAWRIAQLHKGDLHFDAHHHPGAKFVLEIPQTLNDN